MGRWVNGAATNLIKSGVPMPRFVVFLTSAAHHSVYYRHVNVVEMKPRARRLPQTVRSREVKQILLRTIPLRIEIGDEQGPAIHVFTRAEKVIEKLNNMTLSVQIADMEDAQGNNGVKNLFNHLWKMETDDEFTPENHTHL